jgi:hypothetical protein
MIMVAPVNWQRHFRREAMAKAEVLALRVLAEQLEHGDFN